MNTFNDNETEYVTVRVKLSPSEAKSGCLRTLKYPGAPSPLQVELPDRLEDGALLYVDAPFVTEYGTVEEQTLAISVQVEKPRRGYGLAAVLMFIAAAALGVLIVIFVHDTRRDTVVSGTQTAQQAVESEVSASPVTPSPTETPLSAAQLRAREIIPNFELRYFLNQLDDRLLSNFCELYSSVSNFKTECTFPESLSSGELENLVLLLSYECPELFQFSTGNDITYYTDLTGNVVSAKISLVMTKDEYDKEYAVCSGVAKTLAEQAEGKSEYEKELLAYDYLTQNCYYNLNAASAANAYGALGDREAKCDGISLAMKWILEEMGIPCMVISGVPSGGGIGHAWNVVCIDGTYYDLDVTNDVQSYERNCTYYGAFNVSRYWIRSSYPENLSFSGFIIIPGSESMNMSYHALNGTFIGTGEEYRDKLFKQLDSLENGQSAYLQFEDGDDYTNFINTISTVMSSWSGLSRGSFNYTLSHLDEFRVCCVSISYV
jgi:hypothetical protein